MNFRHLSLGSLVTLTLVGCGGGDINFDASSTVGDTLNAGGGGGGGNNPCAQYTDPTTQAIVQGAFDGTNCTYDGSFVGATNPLTVDLTIPFISGVHIFQDALFVGENVTAGATPAAGDGPTLTIAAGNTLAFQDQGDYVTINRGSRIIADGTAVAPITFTAFRDAVTGNINPEAVQEWGGMVINGNAITNACTQLQRDNDDCHVPSEGIPAADIRYGGSDNTEDSGVMRYVVVKHTGFEVAPDNELNGITFNAVGSGTTLENIEVYSTFDDGVEFFGGAVSIDNLVALYVRDDSIDYSDGWVGSINRALVIHSVERANRCVEGDNISETRDEVNNEPLDTAPVTNPTIANMTCITSNYELAGDDRESEGVTLRRGPQSQFVDSIIFGAFNDDVGEDNECFELDDDVTRNWAQNGQSSIRSTIIACEQAVKDSLENGDPISEWVLGANPSTNGGDYSANTQNVVIEELDLFANANLQILEPNSFYTSTTLTDNLGNPITITPVGAQLGAVLAADDWTAGWTYGLDPTNRGKPLWFE
jgi:hypothetical protein